MALPPEAGKPHTLPPEIRYAGEIATAVECKLNHVTPQSLNAQSESDEAQKLGLLFDFLSENKLMGIVDRKVTELKQQRSTADANNSNHPIVKQSTFELFGMHDASPDSEPKDQTGRRYKKRGEKKPRQMHLSEAHANKYEGFMNLEPERQKTPDEIAHEIDEILTRTDERRLAQMFRYMDAKRKPMHRNAFNKILRAEMNDILKVVYEQWGVMSEAERRAWLTERMDQRIAVLKELGIWSIIMEGLTPESAQEIHTILAEYAIRKRRERRRKFRSLEGLNESQKQ